jgi:TRAP transporter 4TM/12TM fusion protein
LAGDSDGDGTGKFRTLAQPLAGVVDGLLASLTIIGSLWALNVHSDLGWVIYTQQYLGLILGIGLVACFLSVKASRGEAAGRGVPWYDWLAAVASTVATGYMVVGYPAMALDLGSITTERWVLGAVTVVLVLEATRRLIGWALVGLAIVVLLYTGFSHLMPGMLYAPNSDAIRIANYMYLDGNAIFGLPLTVFSTIIITFILFGQTLYALRGDKVLTDVALSVMGRYRGGPAKVAVAGSSLFGTISGSVISNVMTDGPVTIPMMVRTGYKPHVAAAIEAVASNGGQILPPVMGITAFLIADWLNIPYADVVLAALFPALLYYVALFVQVDLEAARDGLLGFPRASLPAALPALRRSWVFVAPLSVLVYTLIVANWQPGKSALAAVGVAIVAGALQRETRPTGAALWRAILGTGRMLLDLVAITGVAGVIIGGLQLSGLAFNLSLVLVTIASGSLILLLVITAALCIVLGMGLPTAVIYLLLASLVAPALIEFGVPDLAAHMFLFYFGTMSSITPPLCFATFAAATIAGCDFWKAGWAGVRLAFVAYIIPFVFVLQPELLMIGSAPAIIAALLTTTVGVALIAAAFAGYLVAPLSAARRWLLALSGLCLIPSPAASQVILAVNAAGLAIAAVVLIPVILRRRAARAVQP